MGTKKQKPTKTGTEAEEQADLQDILAKVEADKLDPPVYVPRH